MAGLRARSVPISPAPTSMSSLSTFRNPLLLSIPLILTACAAPATPQQVSVAPTASGYAIQRLAGFESLEPGRTTQLGFRITRAGTTVTTFEVTHEKLLHLIVVRKDLSQFQHLHPELDTTTGTFTVPLTLAEEGTYTVFADFQPRGGAVTVLRGDVSAGGASRAERLAIDDGPQKAGAYTVTPMVESPIPAGVETLLVFAITKDGAPVTDLQNYLGAKGHAVALKEETLEYLHTHPAEHGAGHGDMAAPLPPGEVHFATSLPTPGRYKVFAQFRPEGNLITVSNVYDVTVPPTGVDLHGGHGASDGEESARAARRVDVEAFQYGFAPATIRASVGEPIELVLRTRDVAHSFAIEELDLNATILPGQETRLTFTAERAGRFPFGCDVYCGEGHPTMANEGGVLIVES